MFITFEAALAQCATNHWCISLWCISIYNLRNEPGELGFPGKEYVVVGFMRTWD